MRQIKITMILLTLNACCVLQSFGADIDHIGSDQNILVICVKYTDVTSTRLSTCDDWVSLLQAEINNFFNQSTFGKTTFNFVAARENWFDLGMDSSDYSFFEVAQKAVELADPFVGFNAFNRVAVVTNFDGFGGQGGGPWWWKVEDGIEGTFMEDGLEVGKRLMTMQVTNEWTDTFPGFNHDAGAAVAAHELGHQLGAPTHYASVRWFPGIGRDVITPWGIMGRSPTLSHFVGWAKYNREWLNSSSSITIGPPTGANIDQLIGLRPLESSTFQRQFIRIPLSNSPNFFGYVVENRQQVNGDEDLPQPGVLISLVDESPNRILKHIALTDPDAPGNMSEAPLETGDFLADPSSGLTITYESNTGNNANVRVNYSLLGSDRPNPSITPWGAPPWETPDIWIDSSKNGWDTYLYTSSDGDPIGNGDRAWVDNSNRVYFKITNSGTLAATNVRVQAFVNSPPGMGDRGADWDYLGTVVIPNLAAGDTATEFVNWVPKVGEHTCIKIVILDAPSDASTSDNLAQENVTAFETTSSSPYQPVLTKFHVNNPFVDEPTDVIFHVRDVPMGWTIMTEPRVMTLKAGQSDWVTVGVFPSGLNPDEEREKLQNEINRPGFVGKPKIEAQVAYADTYIPIGGVEVWTHLVEKTTLECKVGNRYTLESEGKNEEEPAPTESGQIQLRPGSNKATRPAMSPPEEAKLRVPQNHGRDAAPTVVRDALSYMDSSALIRPETQAQLVQKDADSIAVAGRLVGPAADKIIAVQLSNGTEKETVFTKTNNDGIFVSRFGTPAAGEWKIRAYFDGDILLQSAERNCGRILVQ